MGCDAGRSGISTYLLRLLSGLEAIAGAGRFELIGLARERSIWLREGSSMGHVDVGSAFAPPVLNVAWHQLALPGLCKRRGYEALLLPAASRRAPWRKGCPTVGVVHDFSHLHVPGKYDAARTLYQDRVLPWLVRRLDHVITISESSRRDVVEHAGVPEERITVIPHGVQHALFRPAPSEGEDPPLFDGRPFVLYVSRLEHPAKGHVPLIEAFDRLKSSRDGRLPHQLVLAGGDWHGSKAVHEAAAAAAHARDIHLLGFVPGGELPALYRSAALFAFPSHYEGFGLPILEAMASGVPVACSNLSSMPEVAGDAALLFDPSSVEEIEEALAIGLLDEERRDDLIRRGLERASRFSWESTARRTLEVLEQVASRVRRG